MRRSPAGPAGHSPLRRAAMARTLGRCVVVALLAAPGTAGAYFEDVVVGARALAMGASAAAAVHDASAYHWNPAGLSSFSGAEFQLYYGQPYDVPGLGTHAVMAGGRWWDTGFSVAWHHFGIADVYGEDLFALAAGRTLARWGGQRLSGGLTYKLGRIGFSPFTDRVSGASVDYGAQSKGSLDVGFELSTPWRVDLCYVGRDLLEPEYRLIEGGGGGKRLFTHSLGAAYRWNRESTVTVSWDQRAGPDQGAFNGGIELWFYDVFALRTGLTNLTAISGANRSPDEFQFSGGFGLKGAGWNLDAGAITSRDLGASYRMTLVVPFRSAEVR